MSNLRTVALMTLAAALPLAACGDVLTLDVEAFFSPVPSLVACRLQDPKLTRGLNPQLIL